MHLPTLQPLAFSFASPALAIAGMALASIPIIIHILNRRRYKVHKWAAMQYLLEALRRNRRRLKFENWMLLAVRCCAILLVGLALSRPMGCGQSAAAKLLGQSSRLHVIILDNSASAAYQVNDPDARTVLDREKRLATGLVARLSGSRDAVCVIPVAAAPSTAATPTYDMEAAKQTIAATPQRFSRADLPAALRLALDAGQREKSFTSRRLYILSDATRPMWQDVSAQPLAQLGPQLAAVFDVVHVDCGEKTATNVAVSSVRSLSSVVTTAMPADFIAQVKAFNGASSSQSLTFQSGTRVLGTVQALPAGAESAEPVLPQVSFADESPVAITARLEPGDQLQEDDTASLALRIRKKLDVLVSEGERGSAALHSPGWLLQLALSPAGAEGATDASVEVISEAELSSRPLVGRDAVILAAPAAISADDAKQLHAYVADGGTLIIFMGEGVNLEGCNRTLGGEGLLPGRLVSLATVAEGQDPYRFDFRPEGALHPLLKAFRGQENSGLSSTRIWTYAKIELDPKMRAQNVLNFVGGNPAITLQDVNRGRVVFVATSADTRWTTLPAKPAFVALIHEILLNTVNADNAWMNIPAGASLKIPRNVVENRAATLSDPTGHQLPLEPLSDRETAFTSEPLERPGLYRLQIDSVSWPISVKFPPEESDLTHVPPAGIKSAMGNIDLALEEKQLPADLVTSRDASDFAWPLMVAALIVLASECTLAMLFKH